MSVSRFGANIGNEDEEEEDTENPSDEPSDIIFNFCAPFYLYMQAAPLHDANGKIFLHHTEKPPVYIRPCISNPIFFLTLSV